MIKCWILFPIVVLSSIPCCLKSFTSGLTSRLEANKINSSIASKPINIRWIRTGSQTQHCITEISTNIKVRIIKPVLLNKCKSKDIYYII